MHDTINGAMFKEMLLFGTVSIAQAQQAINDLNVFPVPDGDTGTNMSLTIQTAAQELKKIEPATVDQAASVTASALLRGARGNSGVITSQILRGLCEGCAEAEEVSTAAIDAAFSRAVEVGVSLSYAAYWRDLMRAPDRSVASSLREHYVTLMPFARFMWLNRRSVQLYTAVQLGCQWGYEKSYTDGYGSFTYLTGQFTPFGIRVGRRLFGYVEWGVGARGLFVGGVGYSFGNFKR